MVAMEFCNQISNAWVMIDDKYDENYFAVLCENGDANPDKFYNRRNVFAKQNETFRIFGCSY